jgi:hypothetical protein
LPSTRGSVSGVLNRRLKEALEGPPGARHADDLAVMHGLITRGVRSRWAGMRLGSLRSRHPEEYALLRAERMANTTSSGMSSSKGGRSKVRVGIALLRTCASAPGPA